MKEKKRHTFALLTSIAVPSMKETAKNRAELTEEGAL